MKIVRSSLLNLVGLGAPLLLALAAIPVLMEGLGAARFGVLTLIWALVSYLGLLDLGLGRALTLRLAAAIERRETDEIGPLCGTAIGLMTALGLAACVGLLAAAPWLAVLLNDAPDLRELKACMQLLALALPFVIVTSGLRAVLEACGAFGLASLIRLALGVWTFAGPVLALWVMGPDLVGISVVLVVGRMLGVGAHYWAARRVLPQAWAALAWRQQLAHGLLRSGGWLLVGNALGPVMGLADRFVLAMFVPVAALAYYATPQEVVTKLWIIPGALSAVLFPVLAARIAARRDDLHVLFGQSVLGLTVVLLPLTLGLATFARPLLTLWLGTAFAAEAHLCAVLFSVGMFVTGLAQLPYTALQSAGHAATTALLHLAELPLFVMALLWAAARYGIAGVAWVWLARVAADAALLFIAAHRLRLQPLAVGLLDAGTIRLLLLAPLCFASLLLPGHVARVSAWLVVTLICVIMGVRAWWRLSGKMPRFWFQP